MYWVTMTDNFMSGWGMAEGKINKLVIECETLNEAEIVAENARNRSEMEYVNITTNKPYYNDDKYFTSWKTREDMPRWFKRSFLNMYILGATEAGELVFVEFRITHRNGYPEFTASFNGVRPFTEEEAISPEEYFEMLVDDMGNDEKWDLCEQNDLRPSELAEWIMQNNGLNSRLY